MTGWHAIVASGSFLSAQAIQGLIICGNESYSPQPWQAMLLYWSVIAFSIITNTIMAGALPKLESSILLIHVFGFIGIFATLLSLGPHGDATDVFTSFSNGGEWPTQGVSFLVGMVGPAFTLLGPDSVVHVSLQFTNSYSNQRMH